MWVAPLNAYLQRVDEHLSIVTGTSAEEFSIGLLLVDNQGTPMERYLQLRRDEARRHLVRSMNGVRAVVTDLYDALRKAGCPHCRPRH